MTGPDRLAVLESRVSRCIEALCLAAEDTPNDELAEKFYSWARILEGSEAEDSQGQGI